MQQAIAVTHRGGMVHNHTALVKFMNPNVPWIRYPHEALYHTAFKPVLYDIDGYIPVIKLALVVPDAGEVRLGDAALGKSAMSSTVKLKLYSSNTTPAEGDTRTTYTEATFTGYAEIAITNANWTTATSTGTTTSAYAEQTFTLSGGSAQDIYGYLFADATAGTIMWSERFPTAPYNLANANDAIKITPQIQWA